MVITITFEKALEILNISDVFKVKESDLTRLEDKAKHKWHPDKIYSLNSPELTRKYTENFQNIPEAIELVRQFIRHGTKYNDKESTQASNSDYDYGESQTYTTEDEPEPTPEETFRKNARFMQSEMKSAWNNIKAQKIKHDVREFVTVKGVNVKEILDEELKEDVPKKCITSAVFFTYYFLLAALIGIWSTPVLVIAFIVRTIQLVSCTISIIPRSKYWLPASINKFALWWVNTGLYFINHKNPKISQSTLVKVLKYLPNGIGYILHSYVISPLYRFIGYICYEFLASKVYHRVNYYADIPEWYILKVMNYDPNTLTDDELGVLAMAYCELVVSPNKPYSV